MQQQEFLLRLHVERGQDMQQQARMTSQQRSAPCVDHTAVLHILHPG